MRFEVPAGTYAGGVLAAAEGWDLLDVLDAILGYDENDWVGRDIDGRLAWILNDAGSAYRVNERGNGLEERVLQPVRDSVSTTVRDASASSDVGSAADHLSNAWQAAYGLHPDPVRAYSEAIKAAESAAHAIIEPNNAKTTLGSMLGVIRNSPSRFTTALFTPSGKDAITPVAGMMRALWEGQTSRHGAQTVTVPETLEAARAAVHLAATLVQWFTSGAVARTP
ncbi:hypothetical protein [Streptomyces scabiei]|uniref:hypothetical protein n=1 Tax=Streptomyces scabiei TaxID=1930 RepID=UPI0018FE1D01|nr:hypothetical protein [Streptomyces scabiei]